MRALILAAGRGTRLREATDRPKCLLEIGGAPLIDRYITGLDSLGIGATVVAGYRAELVQAQIGTLAPATRADVIVNPQFELGSIVSLARGLENVDDDLILMDGDVFFHSELLPRLVQSPNTNALLVDEGSEFTGEEYMAGIDAGLVTELRRAAVPGHDQSGEWVGFARLTRDAARDLHLAVTRQIAAGETAGGYEDSLASLLASHQFRCVPTAGLPWVEIDFPEDRARAEDIAANGRGRWRF